MMFFFAHVFKCLFYCCSCGRRNSVGNGNGKIKYLYKPDRDDKNESSLEYSTATSIATSSSNTPISTRQKSPQIAWIGPSENDLKHFTNLKVEREESFDDKVYVVESTIEDLSVRSSSGYRSI